MKCIEHSTPAPGIAMKMLRLTLILSTVVFCACKDPDRHDDDSTIDPMTAEQVQLCEKICLKPLCNPTIEPGPGVEEECNMYCTDNVDAAQQDEGCTDDYQRLLECLDGLSCDEFYLWLEMEPGVPCIDEESQLALDCPGVEVRNANG